jgi:hypothetical protein
MGSSWIYPAMTASIRISILFLYHRTFGAQMLIYREIIYILLALQGIYLVVFSIMPGFVCHPLDKAWTVILERHIYCSDWYYYYLSVALYSCSMAFDGILLVFPLYPISQLHLPLRRRLGVAFILILGTWYVFFLRLLFIHFIHIPASFSTNIKTQLWNSASVAAAFKLAIFVLQMRRINQINPICTLHSLE